MERCGEGLNWQIGDELLSSANPEEAEKTFRERIIQPLTG
jgi:hypothetical protein